MTADDIGARLRGAVPRFIAIELEYAKQGYDCFIASRPVFDWGAVRAQMIWLHAPAAREVAS